MQEADTCSPLTRLQAAISMYGDVEHKTLELTLGSHMLSVVGSTPILNLVLRAFNEIRVQRLSGKYVY